MNGVAMAAAERRVYKTFRDAIRSGSRDGTWFRDDVVARLFLAALAAIRCMDMREAIPSITTRSAIAGRHHLSTPPGMVPWSLHPSKAPNRHAGSCICRVSRMKRILPRRWLIPYCLVTVATLCQGLGEGSGQEALQQKRRKGRQPRKAPVKSVRVKIAAKKLRENKLRRRKCERKKAPKKLKNQVPTKKAAEK